MTKHILLFMLVLISSSLACALSFRAYPPGNVLYQSDEFGNFELFSINPKNTSPMRITNNSANDVSPAYIAASNQIGFVSDQNSRWNLYTMDLSGDDIAQVTDDEDSHIDYPDWSADGKLIAASLVQNCSAESESCMYELYVLAADGTILRKLSDTDDSEWVPDWSPDGEKIAFMSDRDGDSEVYVVDNDGFNLKKLTDNDWYDGRPRWSPDGTQISFETDREGGDWDIFIMDADGRNPKPVTANSTDDFSQSWSPDGGWFVYVSNADGDNEIYIIDVNGKNQLRLTNNTYNDTSPIWIPK